MAVHAGTQVGKYEILSPIGSGGMGEVYRARDTKLNREGAIKVLPDAFALDPDRLARFKREAQVLASLNHPNIAAIYGFEESNGTQALILELVEGPTLADCIAQGPIPLADVEAESLYEAPVLGIRRLNEDPWIEKIGPATVLDIEVREPSTKHAVALQQVERWLAGATTNPTEASKKAKLKMMLLQR